MKRLLTLSLLLFSVDVFTEDEYCYVWKNTITSVISDIEEFCDKDDILSVRFDTAREPISRKNETWTMNQLSAWFCDFENEIIINSQDGSTYLVCTLNDNEQRKRKKMIKE